MHEKDWNWLGQHEGPWGLSPSLPAWSNGVISHSQVEPSVPIVTHSLARPLHTSVSNTITHRTPYEIQTHRFHSRIRNVRFILEYIWRSDFAPLIVQMPSLTCLLCLSNYAHWYCYSLLISIGVKTALHLLKTTYHLPACPWDKMARAFLSLCLSFWDIFYCPALLRWF
jgi:hypothetical protein